jgi:hypothetical protein
VTKIKPHFYASIYTYTVQSKENMEYLGQKHRPGNVAVAEIPVEEGMGSRM